MALRILRGDKSYLALVAQWLESVKLPPSQQGPFLAPVEQVLLSGRKEGIQRILDTEWCEHMLPDAQRVVSRFPFNQDSGDDTTPQELGEVLNPQTGTFFDMFRRYFEPRLGVPREGRLPRAPVGARDVADPARRLYGRERRRRSFRTPLGRERRARSPYPCAWPRFPFEPRHQPARGAHATCTSTSAKLPSSTSTRSRASARSRSTGAREPNSQVGIQLTDLDSKENSFPEPIAVQGSHWSFLRLLKRGESAPVKEPANATLYTWAIPHRLGGPETTNARFVVTGDPWAAFSLGKVVRAASCGRTN